MLASNIQRIYIDPEWVANEYFRRCKAGVWNKENDTEVLKSWNIEQVLEAEVLGNGPPVRDRNFLKLGAEELSDVLGHARPSEDLIAKQSQNSPNDIPIDSNHY